MIAVLNNYIIKKFLLFIFLIFSWPFYAQAVNLAKDLSGCILLDVQGKGEAWYIYPSDLKRYYLGRPLDAYNIMRQLGLGIAELDFQKIAQAGMPVTGDLTLARRLAGRIILRTESHGEAWYIYPKDLKKYYLGRPADAWSIMRQLSLGITRDNLAKIHKPGVTESINSYSNYEHKKININNQAYTIDIVTIDLANPKLKIIFDTADTNDCLTNCQVKPLSYYAFLSNGFAGINGSYFCTSGSCEKNYYFFPIFNSHLNKMINESQLKYWTTGPIIAFDENNKFYYFKDSREFKNVAWFEETYRVKLQAAIGNKPRLIENKLNQLIEWEIDQKQKTVKTTRNALAYKDSSDNPGKGQLYLVITHNTTVPILAEIMQNLEMDYALNLDGGYSSALIYNGEYMVGPGRDIPNALVFAEE